MKNIKKLLSVFLVFSLLFTMPIYIYAEDETEASTEVEAVQGTSLSSLAAKVNGFVATWNSVENITGYQIQYSTSPKFVSSDDEAGGDTLRTITIDDAEATTKTVNNLKSKKKYYVRIRTFSEDDGKRYYSAWSAAKSVTTKAKALQIEYRVNNVESCDIVSERTSDDEEETDIIYSIEYVGDGNLDKWGFQNAVENVDYEIIECSGNTVVIKLYESYVQMLYEGEGETLIVNAVVSFPPPHTHIYKPYVLKNATCTEDGLIIFVCEEDNKSYYENIAATGHSFSKNESHCLNGCGEVNKDYVVTEKTEATITQADNTTTTTTTTTTTQPATTTATATVKKPKATSIKKATAGKKQVKITWKAISGVNGYQIQYSTDSKFKKGNKTVTVKGAKKTSTTIKKLKSKKKYYVRVRTYNNKKYSSWSRAKSVKIK